MGGRVKAVRAASDANATGPVWVRHGQWRILPGIEAGDSTALARHSVVACTQQSV